MKLNIDQIDLTDVETLRFVAFVESPGHPSGMYMRHNVYAQSQQEAETAYNGWLQVEGCKLTEADKVIIEPYPQYDWQDEPLGTRAWWEDEAQDIVEICCTEPMAEIKTLDELGFAINEAWERSLKNSRLSQARAMLRSVVDEAGQVLRIYSHRLLSTITYRAGTAPVDNDGDGET